MKEDLSWNLRCFGKGRFVQKSSWNGSYKIAIKLIIEQWDTFRLQFESAASDERCHTAGELCGAFKDPQNLLYLLFVRKTFEDIVEVNKLFHAEEVVDVTHSTEDLLLVYRNLLQTVAEPSHLSKFYSSKLPILNFADHTLPVVMNSILKHSKMSTKW